MAGFWERQQEAERARRLAAYAAGLRAQAERGGSVERARQAAMAGERVVPATAVVPVVREAQRRSFWDRLPTGTPMVRPIEEQPTVEEFAAQMRPAGQLVSDVLFGPEVESVRPGTQQAGLLERFARTQAGEQEFRTAAERAQEGRAGAAVGWGLLGLAGAVPFFGDIAQGAAGVSRAARGAGAAADVARGADVRVSARSIPTQPQTGKSVLDDATPGLADGDAVIRGVDEGFRVRGQDSPWVPGERVAPEAPGISIGRVNNYEGPYYLNEIRDADLRSWREAVEIIKEIEPRVIVIDPSFYSPSNPRMRELFNQAAEMNDWDKIASSPVVYDPLGYGNGTWFDSPDEDSIRAFSEALYARASSQAYANNRLLQQQALRRIAELDPANQVRGLVRIEDARFGFVSQLSADAYPMIQTDAFLFDSRISRNGFLNQYQTGTSGGDLNTFSRIVAESSMLGIPPHLGATHRPVYGFLGRIPVRGSADVGAEIPRYASDPMENMGLVVRRIMNPNSSHIEQYGNISVVFDRSKLSDVTFTLGDSLGSAENGKLIASNAADITPDSLLVATAESITPGQRSGNARYLELQYVGPQLSDITAIYMRDDAPYRTVLNALRRAGLSDVEIIVGAR